MEHEGRSKKLLGVSKKSPRGNRKRFRSVLELILVRNVLRAPLSSRQGWKKRGLESVVFRCGKQQKGFGNQEQK